MRRVDARFMVAAGLALFAFSNFMNGWLSHDDAGRPVLETRGTVAATAARLGVTRWHVSISHDAGICVAMVVAER